LISTSRCDYQVWQLKLLYWSIKKSNQKGKLILLVSSDELHAGETPHFNFPPDVTFQEHLTGLGNGKLKIMIGGEVFQINIKP